MNHMYLRGWVLSMAMLGVACEASEQSQPGDQHDVAGRASEEVSGAGGSTPVGECHWPSNLAPLGTQTRDVCVATRAYLSCSTGGGGGVLCPSNDAVSCADPVDPQFQVVSCTDTCGADQYVAMCGGIGPGAVPEPPAGCTFATANPGGIATYCCPCE